MASRAALLLVRATPLQFSFKPKKALIFNRNYAIKSSPEPPDVQRLAETARISLAPHEVEEFAPKIQQVIDWYLDLERATCWNDLYHNINSKASIDVNHKIIGIKEIFSYLMVSASIKFGQLQAVDLQNVEPAIRADNEGETLREDSPEIFENRDAILAAVPSYEDSYIKVPKVLNKE